MKSFNFSRVLRTLYAARDLTGEIVTAAAFTGDFDPSIDEGQEPEILWIDDSLKVERVC